MIDVELRDITIGEAGPDAGWNALLVVDGEPLGGIRHDDDHGISHAWFVEGRDERDVGTVMEALADEDPDLGHSALSVRCAELVAWEWIRRGVVDILSTEAIGIVGEGSEVELRAVVVPDGGTLDSAISYLRKTEPGIVILNDMEESAAVEAYLTVGVS